jgi:hypothetical protein
MTPERMARLVAQWVRFYTRGLPSSVAERRVDELDADVHDQIAHERACGTTEWRIVLGIGSRLVRGVGADAAWRGRQAKATARMSSAALRSVLRVGLVAALILSVPLVAMQVTDEVVWSRFDFVVAGTILVGTGLLLELAARTARNHSYRAAAVVAIAAAFLLVWLNLAVGIIGEPNEPANALYIGVLAVGVAGALLARFRPTGMARAALATALAQALVAVVALLAGKAQSPVSSVSEIVALNGMFVALFIASAWLFRHAARRQPPVGARS